MVGKLRLNQYFARPVAASRASGNLHDGLREPFGSAEVSAEESMIGIHDDHQRHVGEVMSLGDHLRADQDARLPGNHALHRRLDVTSLAHGIPVEAHLRHVGEKLCQLLFDALRALSHRPQGKSALRTALRQWRIGAAMMAAQASCGLVHGQACITFAAGRRPPAGSAQESGRIPAAIEKHQHLALRTQMAPDGFDGGS